MPNSWTLAQSSGFSGEVSIAEIAATAGVDDRRSPTGAGDEKGLAERNKKRQKEWRAGRN